MRLPTKVILDGQGFTAHDLAAVALLDVPFEVRMSKGVVASRKLLEEKLRTKYRIYGVNTNYGKDVSLIAKDDQIVDLQKNCIRALLCGASRSGESLPLPVIKGAILARINCLSMGYSAVRPCVIKKLAEALRAGLIPCVPPFGSVGASGDLIPSAYIANFLFSGFASDALSCYTPKGIMPLREAYVTYRRLFKPIRKVAAKECLSIINSVSFCASIASLVLFRLKKATDLIAVIMALASQAVRCFEEDFSPYVQELRSGSKSGAVRFAKKVWVLNSPSPLLLDAEQYRTKTRRNIPLQDAYSLGRCASQHLDSLLDIQDITEQKLDRILNRVHDNPIIDPYLQRVSHSGNFYAGDIASRMDWTRVEIGKTAKLLHAVINRLLDEHKNNGLGANLVWKQDGTQNGFKGLNLLETDLTTDLSGMVAMSPLTVSTERDNQDIVSLGMGTARKAYADVDALENLVAVALVCALQAFDLRIIKEGISLSEESFNPRLLEIRRTFRAIVPFLGKDTSFHHVLENLKSFIRDKGHTISIDQS